MFWIMIFTPPLPPFPDSAVLSYLAVEEIAFLDFVMIHPF